MSSLATAAPPAATDRAYSYSLDGIAFCGQFETLMDAVVEVLEDDEIPFGQVFYVRPPAPKPIERWVRHQDGADFVRKLAIDGTDE